MLIRGATGTKKNNKFRHENHGKLSKVRKKGTTHQRETGVAWWGALVAHVSALWGKWAFKNLWDVLNLFSCTILEIFN